MVVASRLCAAEVRQSAGHLPRRGGVMNINCVRTIQTFKESEAHGGLTTEKLDEIKVQQDAVLSCARNTGGQQGAANGVVSAFMADGAAALGTSAKSLEKVLKRMTNLKMEATRLLEVQGDHSKLKSLVKEYNCERSEAIRLRMNLAIQREAMGFFDPNCELIAKYFPIPKSLKFCDGELQ